MEIINQNQYKTLISEIGQALTAGRQKAAWTVNTQLINTYWQIGQYIVEYEQKGNEKAIYGSELLKRLSKDLTDNYGKGFGLSNLKYIRKFYLAYPKGGTLSHLLTWSHYYEILKLDDTLTRNFYTKQCEIERWTVRELKRQMKSMLFERVALSSDKKVVLDIANKGIEVQKPEDVFRDEYVLEFTGLPQLPVVKEDTLERALVKNLEMFLLELGKGFAFVGRQYNFNIGGRRFKVDLVFYHYILKTFVLIDLKRGEVQHEDIGQMNFYLNYFKEEMNNDGDNDPIGIVLGAMKDDLVVKYATQSISTQLFVSKYQLYLPNKEQLRQKLLTVMEQQQEVDEGDI